jgi:hypothetical protein
MRIVTAPIQTLCLSTNFAQAGFIFTKMVHKDIPKPAQDVFWSIFILSITEHKDNFISENCAAAKRRQRFFLRIIDRPALFLLQLQLFLAIARKGKGKGKVLGTGHEGPEGEQMYSSSIPSTSALDGGGWSMPRPDHFTLGKDPYPLYRRLRWPQGRSGLVRKISPPPGFYPRTVQPVASQYTDCALPAPAIVRTTCTLNSYIQEFHRTPSKNPPE